MDNQTLVRDEIEALSAIYGEDWTEEDSNSGVYSIALTRKDLEGKLERSIRLEFRLPPDYPLQAPPFYTVSAPWMSRDEKIRLTSNLDEIYCQHPGESIIYLWIEKAREFLTDEADQAAQVSEQQQEEENDQVVDDVAEYCVKLSLDGTHKHHRNSSENPITIYHGHPIIDRRSTFQAHLATVYCVEDVKDALATLMTNKKIAAATHNMSAYRIAGAPHGTCFQDCNDDGETHAGSHLLHLLQILDVKNVLVVVSRWFGGILLGADRFKHIKNAARDLIKDCGYLETKQIQDEANQGGKKKKSK